MTADTDYPLAVLSPVIAGLSAPRNSASAAGVEVTSATDGRAWDDFVASHPLGTFEHRWGWRAVFKNAVGHDSEYLVARRGSCVVGVLPLVLFRSLVFGRTVMSLPMVDYGGVLSTDEAAIPALVERATEIARAFKAQYIELRHRAPVLGGLTRQHKVSMRLMLPATVDALWDGLDRKVRNQVRKAQKSQLTVQNGGAELLEAFYPIFSTNMRDLGTPTYPMRLFSEVFEQMPGGGRVYVVRHDGQPVAAAVMLYFRDSVLVPWASSLRAFRHLSANTLLYWSMLEGATREGMKVFDFGRSTPGAGTYHFKEQWGAVAEPQHWEYVLLKGSRVPGHGPSDGRFSVAIAAWQRLPLWLANRLGPAIVRHLP